MSKCAVCVQVKGKRGCQQRSGALICPRCCAEIRNLECAGCTYYAQANRFAVEKMKQGGKPPPHFVARIDPQVDDLIVQALELAEAGQLVEAEKRLRGLLVEYPDIYTVHFGMSSLHLLKNEFELAMPYLDRALEIFPYFALAWFNKAVLHLKKWEVAEFLQATKKVLEYGNPEDEYVRHAKEELDELKASLALEGMNLDDYILAGQLFDQACDLMEQKKYEEALIGFRRVLTINRKNHQSYGNMGLCYANLGYRSKALEMFDRALAIEPDYEVAMVNRLMAERMQEGEKPSGGSVRNIRYHDEYGDGKKSLLAELAGELEQTDGQA